MEIKIGLITEGVTDQIVIEKILLAWADNEAQDLLVDILQPKANESGNWDKVFKYCESTDFRGAFTSQFAYDFVVIQIDTDFMQRENVGEKYRLNTQNLTVIETIDSFKAKIIELIGQDFYRTYQSQIIFAIAVEEIECWFLPIYFENQPQKVTKIVNCIDTLNPVLFQKEGFYIHTKDLTNYRKIVKHFKNRKAIEKYSEKNESFKIFIQSLQEAL